MSTLNYLNKKFYWLTTTNINKLIKHIAAKILLTYTQQTNKELQITTNRLHNPPLQKDF